MNKERAICFVLSLEPMIPGLRNLAGTTLKAAGEAIVDNVLGLPPDPSASTQEKKQRIAERIGQVSGEFLAQELKTKVSTSLASRIAEATGQSVLVGHSTRVRPPKKPLPSDFRNLERSSDMSTELNTRLNKEMERLRPMGIWKRGPDRLSKEDALIIQRYGSLQQKKALEVIEKQKRVKARRKRRTRAKRGAAVISRKPWLMTTEEQATIGMQRLITVALDTQPAMENLMKDASNQAKWKKLLRVAGDLLGLDGEVPEGHAVYERLKQKFVKHHKGALTTPLIEKILIFSLSNAYELKDVDVPHRIMLKVAKGIFKSYLKDVDLSKPVYLPAWLNEQHEFARKIRAEMRRIWNSSRSDPMPRGLLIDERVRERLEPSLPDPLAMVFEAPATVVEGKIVDDGHSARRSRAIVHEMKEVIRKLSPQKSSFTGGPPPLPSSQEVPRFFDQPRFVESPTPPPDEPILRGQQAHDAEVVAKYLEEMEQLKSGVAVNVDPVARRTRNLDVDPLTREQGVLDLNKKAAIKARTMFSLPADHPSQASQAERAVLAAAQAQERILAEKKKTMWKKKMTEKEKEEKRKRKKVRRSKRSTIDEEKKAEPTRVSQSSISNWLFAPAEETEDVRKIPKKTRKRLKKRLKRAKKMEKRTRKAQRKYQIGDTAKAFADFFTVRKPAIDVERSISLDVDPELSLGDVSLSLPSDVPGETTQVQSKPVKKKKKKKIPWYEELELEEIERKRAESLKPKRRVRKRKWKGKPTRIPSRVKTITEDPTSFSSDISDLALEVLNRGISSIHKRRRPSRTTYASTPYKDEAEADNLALNQLDVSNSKRVVDSSQPMPLPEESLSPTAPQSYESVPVIESKNNLQVLDRGDPREVEEVYFGSLDLDAPTQLYPTQPDLQGNSGIPPMRDGDLIDEQVEDAPKQQANAQMVSNPGSVDVEAKAGEIFRKNPAGIHSMSEENYSSFLRDFTSEDVDAVLVPATLSVEEPQFADPTLSIDEEQATYPYVSETQ